MSGRVPSILGGGPGSISQVRDRLELLREPVDPPRLGIDTGGHDISDTQVLTGDCRRVHDQSEDENNDGHDAQLNDRLMRVDLTSELSNYSRPYTAEWRHMPAIVA